MDPYAPDAQTRRRELLEFYRQGLNGAAGGGAVQAHLSTHPPAGPLYLVAVGKAAVDMAVAALDALGEAVARGLVITKHGYGRRPYGLARCELIEAGHPLPDGDSLRAGQALLAFLAAAPPGARFLFLVSGGASSLVEVLPEGVELSRLQEITQRLLAEGYDIGAINYWRRRLSLIKGGRLVHHLNGRAATVLLLSDVPDDDPATIGSGLLVPAREAARPKAPAWLAELLAGVETVPAPPPEAFAQVHVAVLVNNATARRAAAAAGARLGYRVPRADELVLGEVADEAQRMLQTVDTEGPGLYVWGGEPAVRLPPAPGRGGRCQALGLHLARAIDGRADIVALAVGTDGSDGPTEDAGALVDGGTRARGEAEGYDIDVALRDADAGAFLEAAGDLVQTGPTGTNVMDLFLVLRTGAPRGAV